MVTNLLPEPTANKGDTGGNGANLKRLVRFLSRKPLPETAAT